MIRKPSPKEGYARAEQKKCLKTFDEFLSSWKCLAKLCLKLTCIKDETTKMNGSQFCFALATVNFLRLSKIAKKSLRQNYFTYYLWPISLSKKKKS